jgi:hypothetical protein
VVQTAKAEAPSVWRRVVSGLRPPRAGAGAVWFARLPSRLAFLLLLVPIWALYAFYASAGTSQWPMYGLYHDLQADAFLKGQLNLPIDPSPALLRAKDPFDIVNQDLWWIDASLYKGKYYMYWGPLPALFQALAKWALHIQGTIGDQYLTFAFLCLASLFGAVLIVRLARRLFPGTPRWLVSLGIVVFACANPTLHAATTASTYHTAIIGAQAWLVAGMIAAFDAVWHAGTARARVYRLIVAGGLWGFVIASRVALLPAIALLVLFTATFEALGSERRLRRVLLDLVCLGTPLTLVALALLTYNNLRFDDWLEFGTKWQLSAYPLSMSVAYWPANLYSYALRPWFASCQFPYLYQEWWSPNSILPSLLNPIPKGYTSHEPLIGFLLGVPLLWLAPWAFIRAPRTVRPRTQRERSYLFCLLSFSVMASVTGILGFSIYLSTMRYLSDVTYGMVLLALLGAYALRMHRFALQVPRATSLVVAVLSALSIVFGVLIGYQGYNGHFHRYNLPLDRKLTRALSLCHGRTPELPFWVIVMGKEPIE